jgi:hypothetical protein
MQMIKAMLLTIGDVIVNNWSTLITMIVVTLVIEALSNYIKACTLRSYTIILIYLFTLFSTQKDIDPHIRPEYIPKSKRWNRTRKVVMYLSEKAIKIINRVETYLHNGPSKKKRTGQMRQNSTPSIRKGKSR